jgi:NAD(P)-dependent dehydrogenase (short-subunit alcohol dehydrogenase family)
VSALPWQRAIVVGASSGIGEALARHLAAGGCRVALVARRAAELARVRDAIVAAGGRADVHPHDVTRTDDVARVFAAACADLGGLDLVVYAAGIMPRIAPDEYGFAVDDAVVRVNLLGAMAWLDETAVRFAAARAGTIVGISSVAGDRGRRGYPAYHASKAGLDAYLESLRNRLSCLGVAVVTIKPGPVDTPMSRGLSRLPLLIDADTAARRTLAVARRGSRVAYVPATWRPIMLVLRSIPGWLFQRLDI